MKLIVNRRIDARPCPPAEATFLAPGGTIGRAAENQLALPDDAETICRVQAALRYGDHGWRLANLSAMSSVSINGHAVPPARDHPLEAGDEVAIGPYVLYADAAHEAGGASTGQADVFGDLIGPGTLPVASLSELAMHPFDMDSAMARNPEDPLAQLPGDAWRPGGESRDPLALFPDPGAPATLSDPTPAMLPAADPLASRAPDPIADTLRAGGDAAGHRTRRDDAPEYGNPMTPPRPRH